MPVLLDSSVYINGLRNTAGLILSTRWIDRSPLWLSAVVIEELYAGADPRDHRVVEKLERDFERAKRVLVPNRSDWSLAGKMLAKLGRKYGFELTGRSRLTNDALIAASASRSGITVITTNRKDFALLAEFCPLQWQSSGF